MVTWDLTTLTADKKELEEKVQAFNKRKGTIQPEQIQDVLKELEEIDILSGKIGGKIQLKFTENTTDQKVVSEVAEVEDFLDDINNQIIFFSTWFKKLSDEEAQPYIENAEKYKYVLERMRLLKQHTLTEKEEQIITIKDSSSAFERLYDVLTNKYVFEYDGKKYTQEEISQFKYSHNRDERKAFYDLVLGKYNEDEHILSEIYKAIVLDWKNEALKLRNYTTSIEVRNKANDIPNEAVEALLTVIQKNINVFQEYFELKKKVLNIEDRYDLYLPLNKEEEKIDYEKSKEIVLEAYKEFDEEMYEKAVEIFEANHVHSEIQEGKRSGAFCSSICKDIPPFIMLNHTGILRDVFTMMHEFGHGIHHMLAQKQTELTFSAGLPLCETASIFGEMILAKKMMKEKPEEKQAILMKLLDDQYASIPRQAYFVLFEKEAHKKIPKATTEELNELYLKLLKDQFGSLPVPEVFKHEWKYIPHIHHYPFYTYAYAFGNLLVLTLYKMYEEEGESFIPKIKNILSAGGSDTPENILKEIGDIKTEAFWEKGFNLIKEEVEELKKVL